MSRQMNFEELKNIKKIKYNCSKHGTIYKPEINTFFIIVSYSLKEGTYTVISHTFS